MSTEQEVILILQGQLADAQAATVAAQQAEAAAVAETGVMQQRLVDAQAGFDTALTAITGHVSTALELVQAPNVTKVAPLIVTELQAALAEWTPPA